MVFLSRIRRSNIIKKIGVLRETVRAKTTNQPTNQKFWYHVTEKPPRHFVPIVFWSGIGANGPKMQNDHKCIIWAKFARLWAKNSNFLGGSKSFGTHVTEKSPRHLVCIVFWSGMGRNGTKMPIFVVAKAWLESRSERPQFWSKARL